ncbi:MAG: hypothetical protein IJU45_08780 [Clostridia bacterium]|nr:hypothetical protein [Clostridia bacterium]
MKKLISVVLAAVTAFSLALSVFAASDVKLTGIDSSAINGKVTTYVGVTETVVFYPEPLEAEENFDIRNCEITVSDESVISVKAVKVEEYRFGSAEVTGLKKGKTEITVKDPSGITCKIKVTVKSKIIYDVQNFRIFLDYLPFYIFMAILRIFNIDFPV